jgi:hypothetical protein
VLLHHPHGALADFRGKLVRLVHGSILKKQWSLLKTWAVQVQHGLQSCNAGEAALRREGQPYLPLTPDEPASTEKTDTIAAGFGLPCATRELTLPLSDIGVASRKSTGGM